METMIKVGIIGFEKMGRIRHEAVNQSGHGCVVARLVKIG